MRLSPWLSLALALPAYAGMPARPVAFEANAGQHGPRALRYTSRHDGLVLELDDRQAAVTLLRGGGRSRVELSLPGARQLDFQSEGAAAGRTHYYLSQAERFENVLSYRSVRAKAVYPGIDWVWHGAAGSLEHDFVVAPGADASRIRLAFGGAVPRIENGDLVLETSTGPLRHQRPVAYQTIRGERRMVDAAYVLERHTARFELGAYDPRYELTIDPALAFASLVGGPLDDAATDFLALKFSTARVACSTQATTAGGTQAVVTRFDATLTTAVFGAANALTSCGKFSRQRDSALLHVTGTTNQASFPRLNSPQASFGGGTDAFVLVLDAATLAVSRAGTVGGSGDETGVGIDHGELGDIFLAGHTSSTNFPVTAGVFQTTYGGGASDAFIYVFGGVRGTKATYAGGNGADTISALSLPNITENGAIMCVAGETSSTNLATSPGAPRTTLQGGKDGWLYCLNNSTFQPSGQEPRTYYGGAGDDAVTGMVTYGNATYIAGRTNSTGTPGSPTGLPLTQAPPSPMAGFAAAFVFGGLTGAFGLTEAALAMNTNDTSFALTHSAILTPTRVDGYNGAPGASAPTQTFLHGTVIDASRQPSLRRDAENTDSWMMAAALAQPRAELKQDFFTFGDIDFTFAGASEGYVAEICFPCSPFLTSIPVTLFSGAGGRIRYGAGLECPSGGSCSDDVPDFNYRIYTAVPDPGFAFAGWSSNYSPLCYNTQPSIHCTKGIGDLAAAFAPADILVSVVGAGTGNVISTPTGTINCPGACGAVSTPSPQTLRAVANQGSFFAGWTGCPSPAGANCTIPASTAAAITATFGSGPPVQLTVITQGTGSGAVTSSSGGIACPGTCAASFNAPVTLTATPNAGSVFTGWTGCPAASTNTCAVPVPFLGTVRATFSPGAAVNLTLTLPTKTGGLSNRLWRFRITNSGGGTATNVQVSSFAVTLVAGGCLPAVTSLPTPSSFPSIAPGAAATFDVQLDLSSCTSALTQLQAAVALQANGGTYNVTRFLTTTR